MILSLQSVIYLQPRLLSCFSGLYLDVYVTVACIWKIGITPTFKL